MQRSVVVGLTAVGIGLFACLASPTIITEPKASTATVAQRAIPSTTTEQGVDATPASQLATPYAYPSGVAFTPPAPPPLPTPVSLDVAMRARTAMIARVERILDDAGRSGWKSIPRQIDSPVLDPRLYYARMDFVSEPKAAGEIPLVLTSLWSGLVHRGLIIFYSDGRGWSHYEVDTSSMMGGEPAFVAAQQQVHNGLPELGIGWNCGGCSFSETEFNLLRYTNGQWSTVWKSQEPEWRGAHGEVTFVSGLDRIAIHYSSFSSPDSKNFFGESNAGPHRWFIDTWKRDGDRYRLLQTVSLPSTYKTAVEFFYALMQGDDKAAAQWTAKSSVVNIARQLGLAYLQKPSWANPDEARGTVLLWVNGGVQAQNQMMNPNYVMHVIKPGSEWLIESIERLP